MAPKRPLYILACMVWLLLRRFNAIFQPIDPERVGRRGNMHLPGQAAPDRFSDKYVKQPMDQFEEHLAALDRAVAFQDAGQIRSAVDALRREHARILEELERLTESARRLAEAKRGGEQRFLQALNIFHRLQSDIRRIQSIRTLEELPGFVEEIVRSMGLDAVRLVLDEDSCRDVCPEGIYLAASKHLVEFASHLNDVTEGATFFIGPTVRTRRFPQVDTVLPRPEEWSPEGSCFVRLLFDKYRPTMLFGVLGLFAKDPERFTPAQATDFLEHYCYLLACNLTTLMDHERLVRLSTVDPLTKAHNRNYLVLHAQRLLDFSERKGFPVCLLFIDLDRFKQVNDTLGHDVGDRVLIEVGDRIRAIVRKHDIFVRLGGDEFIVMLTDVGADQVSSFVGRIVGAIEEIDLQTLAGRPTDLRVGASVGVTAHVAGLAIEDMLADADRRMYGMKKSRGKRDQGKGKASGIGDHPFRS
ncbi:MAG: sensor domain-containing diguanylate cyclase [Deltaproteobacteria bacterium]|nr:sensor domain-containing diguanylate cyclase [Deltaproteobacteria bacterium]